jgi:HTH-type transcriptional regulator, competence development regulator
MTPFGKMLRQERKDRGMLLGTMAERLGISSPYLSQLETGAKPLKDNFVEKVIALLDLSRSDADALRRAAAKSLPQSVDTVTISLRPDATARDRELASNLALGFNRWKPEMKAKLREMLKDENNG